MRRPTAKWRALHAIEAKGQRLLRSCLIKWFKHDSNANTDTKLKKLRHKYGITGYGLYWYCLELIAGRVDKENVSFELEEDAEIIALEWSLDQLRVQEIMGYMCDLGLFENKQGVITCLKMAFRLDDTNAKNPEMKAIAAMLSAKKSESVGITPNNSDQTRLDQIRSDKTRLEEIRKDDIDSVESPASKRKTFKKPTVQEISDYMLEKGLHNHAEAEKFFDYYESNGWKVSRNPMKDWKAAVRNWLRNNYGKSHQQPNKTRQRPIVEA